MDSASQSNGDTAAARHLVDEMETLTRRGWKLASPVWFPLLCAGVAMLASVPVAVVLDMHNGVGIYWAVVGPLTAVASGWYFATRGAQAPNRTGLVVLMTGAAMLIGTLTPAWLYQGAWAAAAPWMVVGIGFGIFAAAWRSVTTAVMALTCVGASVLVAAIDPADGYALLALIVGVTAAVAAIVELTRIDPIKNS